MKNYNEAMLESMSNGVVTLDEHERIVTCNAAGLRILRALSAMLYGRRAVLVALLLPPLLWFGVVYLGALLSLLAQSFFSVDDFSGEVIRKPTLEIGRAHV